MNLSKYKWWRALLHRMIVKQQSKREQAHPVCLQECKSTKRWIIHRMITIQQVKNEQIKRKQA